MRNAAFFKMWRRLVVTAWFLVTMTTIGCVLGLVRFGGCTRGMFPSQGAAFTHSRGEGYHPYRIFPSLQIFLRCRIFHKIS